MFNIFKNKPIVSVDQLKVTKENRAIFFEEYYKKRVPLLIKDGAKDWPLIKKWNKEYIIENSGNYICNIVKDSRPASSKDQTTLANYFKRFSQFSTLTLDDFDLKNKPSYLNDIQIPNLFFGVKDIYRFFFYHSNENQGTLPHNHGDAFNILQNGTKHWIFYDANSTIASKGRNEMQSSFQKYPKGSFAKDYFKKELKSLNKKIPDLMECFQEKGDIVYVPRQYAHAVLNKSEVMGAVFETKPLRL